MFRLFILCSLLLVLTACGDDPAGPGSAGGRTFDATLTLATLDVDLDCDDFSGDYSARAGDFRLQARLYREVDGERTSLDESAVTLVQAVDGENKVVGLSATGGFSTAADARLIAEIQIYETDPDGVRHFDRTTTVSLEYRDDLDCWVYDGDDTCLRTVRADRVVQSVVRIRDDSGDPCALDLYWTLDVIAAAD